MCTTVSHTATIANKLGLHARPAMMFVETATRFEAEVRIRRCDQSDPVDGKSIMQMLMLAATEGTDVEITAVGPDARAAVDELVALIGARFHEE